MKTTDGFLVICTSCNGLTKAPADTREEAENLANIHLSLDSQHKTHKGHIVAIISAELVTTAV